MKKKTKIILEVQLASFFVIALIYSVFSIGFSTYFYQMIFPRRDNTPALELTYADVDSSRYPRTEAEILSGDNLLEAYRYDADTPRALIVIAGGIGSDCDSHLPEILYFLDRGFSVLCYSCTGVCGSGGDSLVGPVQPSLDLSAALEYASHQSLPILIYGHSAGAFGAAIHCGDEAVKGCVCIAGFDSATELMHQTAQEQFGLLADIEYPALSFHNYLLFGSLGFQRASKKISESDTPVLIGRL